MCAGLACISRSIRGQRLSAKSASLGVAPPRRPRRVAFFAPLPNSIGGVYTRVEFHTIMRGRKNEFRQTENGDLLLLAACDSLLNRQDAGVPLPVFAMSITEPSSAFRAVHRRITRTTLTITGDTYALQVHSFSLFFLRGRGEIRTLQGGPVRLEVFTRHIPGSFIHRGFCGIAGRNVADRICDDCQIFLCRSDLCVRGTTRCDGPLRLFCGRVARNRLTGRRDSLGILGDLGCVTLAQINRSDSTPLPGSHHCASIIAPQMVVRRKTRGGLSPQDAPFRPVCARVVRHMAIVANPQPSISWL
jgi:hypothetical protein